MTPRPNIDLDGVPRCSSRCPPFDAAREECAPADREPTEHGLCLPQVRRLVAMSARPCADCVHWLRAVSLCSVSGVEAGPGETCSEWSGVGRQCQKESTDDPTDDPA